MDEVVIGLDAGISVTGIAVWSCFHQRIFKTFYVKPTTIPKKQRTTYFSEDFARRCRELSKRLDNVFSIYRVRAVVAELPHGGAQNQKAAFGMGAAIAVITSVVTLRKVPLYVVTPTEIKRIVSEKGPVEKETIIEYARAKWSERIIPYHGVAEHIADACMTIEVANRRLNFLLKP